MLSILAKTNRNDWLYRQLFGYGLILALWLGCTAMAQPDTDFMNRVLQLATAMQSSQSQAGIALEKSGEELLFGTEFSENTQAEQVVHRFEKIFLKPLQEAARQNGNTQVSQWLGPLNGMPPVPRGRAGWAAYAALWIQSRRSLPLKNQDYGAVSFYRELASRWSQQPELLIPWLNRLSVSFSLDLILTDIVPVWAEKDPALAAKYLQMLQTELPNSTRVIAQHWIRRDHQACIAWLDQLSTAAPLQPNNFKGAKSKLDPYQVAVIEPWFKAGPKAALSWFRYNIPSRTQSFSDQMALRAKNYLELLSHWLIEDPAAVTSWVLELGNPNELVHQVTLIWTETDPLAAISWAKGLDEEETDQSGQRAKTLALAMVRFRVLAPTEASALISESQFTATTFQRAIPAEDKGFQGREPYFHYLNKMATILSGDRVLALYEQQKLKQAIERGEVRRLADRDFDSALAWLQANRAWRRTNNRQGPASVLAWPLHATEVVFSLWAQRGIQSALVALSKVNSEVDVLPALFFLGKNWPDHSPVVSLLEGLSSERQSALLRGLSLSTLEEK